MERVLLQCQNASGSSQPRDQLIELSRNERNVTQIIKVTDGIFYFRGETTENEGNRDAIVHIISQHPSLVLQPLRCAVTISSRVSPAPYGGVTIEPLSPSDRHFIYLRHGDVIDFRDQGLKVTIMADVQGSTPEPAVGDDVTISKDLNGDAGAVSEVQVKSSNVEPEIGGEDDDDDDDTDSADDEEDLDQPSSSSSRLTPGRPTPATTSRPTEPTIKETPSHTRTRSLNEVDPPFSTARDYSTSPTAIDAEQRPIGDPESPSIKARQKQGLRAEATEVGPGVETISPVATAISGSRMVLEGELESDEFQSPKKHKVTYSKRNRRSATASSSTANKHQGAIDGEVVTSGGGEEPSHEAEVTHEAHVDSDLASDGYFDAEMSEAEQTREPVNELPEEQGEAAPSTFSESIKELAVDVDGAAITEEGVVEETGWLPLTSDAMNMRDASREAARRSLPGGSWKRKRSIEKDDNDNEAEQDSNEDEQAQEEEEPEEPVVSPIKKKKSRLTKAARIESPDSAEEIAVATRRRSSPRVVINQRSSKTPTSTATSSTLSGKPPKLLISSDSLVLKHAPLKAWLKKNGATTIDDIPTRRTNFVCVVNATHTLKSAKVLRSLAMGKLVVTDKWLFDSKTSGDFLEMDEYVHKALKTTVQHDHRKLFDGKNLFFTNSLVNAYTHGWSDIQDLAKEAGASHVQKGSAATFKRYEGRIGAIIFGNAAEDDNDVARLIHEHDRVVYHKDLLTHTILTGELDLESDTYKLRAPPSTKKGRR